jgi:hypothetical protein
MADSSKEGLLLDPRLLIGPVDGLGWNQDASSGSGAAVEGDDNLAGADDGADGWWTPKGGQIDRDGIGIDRDDDWQGRWGSLQVPFKSITVLMGTVMRFCQDCRICWNCGIPMKASSSLMPWARACSAAASDPGQRSLWRYFMARFPNGRRILSGTGISQGSDVHRGEVIQRCPVVSCIHSSPRTARVRLMTGPETPCGRP